MAAGLPYRMLEGSHDDEVPCTAAAGACSSQHPHQGHATLRMTSCTPDDAADISCNQYGGEGIMNPAVHYVDVMQTSSIPGNPSCSMPVQVTYNRDDSVNATDREHASGQFKPASTAQILSTCIKKALRTNSVGLDATVDGATYHSTTPADVELLTRLLLNFHSAGKAMSTLTESTVQATLLSVQLGRGMIATVNLQITKPTFRL